MIRFKQVHRLHPDHDCDLLAITPGIPDVTLFTNPFEEVENADGWIDLFTPIMTIEAVKATLERHFRKPVEIIRGW